MVDETRGGNGQLPEFLSTFRVWCKYSDYGFWRLKSGSSAPSGYFLPF